MRKFLYKILLFVLLLCIGPAYVVYYNLKHDPYGVVLGNMETQFTEPNVRFLKVKHLINNPNKHDSYIMGSSRALKMNPDSISIPGKWYNLAYSEGLPSEHIIDLKTLLANDVQIKRLLIAVDNITYYVDDKVHSNQVPRKRYVNWHDPYFEFVFLKPDKKLKKTIEAQIDNPNKPFYDIYGTGMPQSSFKDLWATNNPEKYVANKRFEKPTWAFYYTPKVDLALKEIAQLIELCNKENIKIEFVVNPMHKATFLKQDLKEYYSFLKGLAALAPYWDFSGLNEITTNNFWYYETSHFRTVIGDRMLDIVLEGKEDTFGQRITKDNIDQVISKKKEEVLRYKEQEKE